MAERPPSDSDDTWADVMKQVHDALDEAQIDGDSLRKSLMDGVKQALDSLDDFLVEPSPSSSAEDERVPVVVVEGGRTDDQPITEGDIPKLHIADDAVEDVAESSGGSNEDSTSPMGSPTLATTVRVFRSGFEALPQSGDESLSPAGPAPILANEGQIALGPDGAQHQTLFRGNSPHIYRVHCDDGIMKVLVDGQSVETLNPGQSLDVEGRFLSIKMAENRPVLGRYTWVARAE